jgi:hypothetical protein
MSLPKLPPNHLRTLKGTTCARPGHKDYGNKCDDNGRCKQCDQGKSRYVYRFRYEREGDVEIEEREWSTFRSDVIKTAAGGRKNSARTVSMFSLGQPYRRDSHDDHPVEHVRSNDPLGRQHRGLG